MKFNWRVRFRNPYFWIGLIGILLMSIGVETSMLTSWELVFDNIVELIKNPFMIGSTFVALWGYIQDFTTEGIGDTDLAMTYRYPRKDTETTADEEDFFIDEEVGIPVTESEVE